MKRRNKSNNVIPEGYKVYDSSDNLIYSNSLSGIERNYEYDNNGNMIRYKDSKGHEIRKEFDYQNKSIRTKIIKRKKRIKIRKGSPMYYIVHYGLPILVFIGIVLLLSIPSSIEWYLGEVPR